NYCVSSSLCCVVQTLEKVSSQYHASYQEGLAEYNSHKNRFPDKIPNELGRVRLRCGHKPGSDYINASFIDGYRLRRAYIATQGPLSETVNDMWRMIWENDCKCIVMLCQTMEQGLESSHCFWPPTVGEEKVYGNIRVWLMKESVHRDITERRLEIEGGIGGVTRMVTLLQLTSWPPGHLPLPKSILSLVELLSKAQRSCSSRHTTVICSDGMGRTGRSSVSTPSWRDSRRRVWLISSRLSSLLVSRDQALSLMLLTIHFVMKWWLLMWTVSRLMLTSKNLCETIPPDEKVLCCV
ncbi:Phosphatidylinositol phosphatase PTPRQ, partial [Geodia barretti]